MKPTLHTTHKVTSQAGAPEGEILMYDIIGEQTDFWTGEKSGISAISFLSDFRKLEAAHDTIRIKINSVGGIVDEGLAIFNAIQYSKKDVHVHNDAVAYSMAGVLMQAAKKENRHAKKQTMLMIHSAAGSAWGRGRLTAQKADEISKEIRKYDELIASAMTTSTGLTQEQILAKWFDGKDHYFTAEEAKAAGLIHDIEEANAVEAVAKDFRIEAFSQHRIAALGGNPHPELAEGSISRFLNKLETGIENLFKSKIENPFSRNTQHATHNPNDMTLEKLAAKFATGDAVAITAEEAKQFKSLLEQHKEARFTQAEMDQKISSEKMEMEKTINLQNAAITELQSRLDKATGTISPAGDEDDITVADKNKKDGSVTAQAKAEWEKAQAKKKLKEKSN